MSHEPFHRHRRQARARVGLVLDLFLLETIYVVPRKKYSIQRIVSLHNFSNYTTHTVQTGSTPGAEDSCGISLSSPP